MKFRALGAFAVAAALAFTVVACGDDEPSSPAAAASG